MPQKRPAERATSKNAKKCQTYFSTLFDMKGATAKKSISVKNIFRHFLTFFAQGKNHQNYFRHFSTIFAWHQFSGPHWGALKLHRTYGSSKFGMTFKQGKNVRRTNVRSHSGTLALQAGKSPRRDQVFTKTTSQTENPWQNKERSISTNPFLRFTKTAVFFFPIFWF